ncbi:septal ring lytic transglycosylase RlpA family protein [Vibrio sp. RC27]
MRTIRFIAITIVISTTLLSGCATKSRYSIKNDVAPDKPLAVDHVEDAQPKYEPYSRGGNKDYSLRGSHYKIIKDSTGFKERGIASWYGQKFHGHLTSNGETYDMYSMSAAHKTLPLPSYVKVTNLGNGKTAIVRVNDRGPFHAGRVIDLSYAAAYKLGVLKTGTANVEIETINISKEQTIQNTGKPIIGNSVIQVIASQHLQKARTLSQDLGHKLSAESFVDSDTRNHRVLLGPFNDDRTMQQTLKRVKKLGYNTAFIRKYIAAK